MSVFLQIGTNDGNDLFRKKVYEKKPKKVILLEPNNNLINKIKNNYSFYKGELIIINRAVYYTDDDEVELFIPSKKGLMGKKADNGITYRDVHFSLLPMNDWGEKEDMVKLKSKTITFESIMKQTNTEEIDYLEIDTEGFDYEIIKMINFSKYIIKQIKFEIFGFPVEKYSRYFNEKKGDLGINGLNYVISKLKDLGYNITDDPDRDAGNKLATLII